MRSLKITVFTSRSWGFGFNAYNFTLQQTSDCWVNTAHSDVCASLNTSSLWGSYGYSPQEWCHLTLFLSMCESEPVYSQTLVLLCLLASWVERHSVSRAHSQFHCLAAFCVLCLTEQCWWWKTCPLALIWSEAAANDHFNNWYLNYPLFKDQSTNCWIYKML